MPDAQGHTAPTLFLLMAQDNGQTVVPLNRVCRDFFGHFTVAKLLRAEVMVMSTAGQAKRTRSKLSSSPPARGWIDREAQIQSDRHSSPPCSL
jgi:hypothetical protein